MEKAEVDVLLVEDDESVRSSSAEVLREAGYTTAEAHDTSTAMGLLASTNFGVLVLDVFLPGESGLWLLDQLETPTPVLLVTAHNYDPEVMARRDKVFLYLQKPVGPPDLLLAVARAMALGGKRLGQD